MKATRSSLAFVKAFEETGKDKYMGGVAGLCALSNFLEEQEKITGEEVILDVMSLCCNFIYYRNLEEFRADYGAGYQSIEDVEGDTRVIRVEWDNNQEDGPFIIQRF